MTKPKPKPSVSGGKSCLRCEMHANGIMDDARYRKITMRDVDKAEAATLAPLTGKKSARFASKPI